MANDLTTPAPKFLGKSSPGQERKFEIPIDASSDEIVTVQITEPACRADNLSLETWASSAILAAQLCRLDVEFPPRDEYSTNASKPSLSIPILELGAGTGLVGITAARLWDQDCVLSDLEPIIPGLWANVDINADLLQHSSSETSGKREPGPSVRCGTLDWTKPARLHLLPRPSQEDSSNEPTVLSCESTSTQSTKAHVILAADTCYSEEHPAMLSDVILQWLSLSPNARVVLGTALRVAYLNEITELWELLEKGGLECAESGQQEAAEKDFDDERLVEWSLWRWKQT